MTMRKKILAGFLAVLLLTCCVGYIAHRSTELMNQQSQQSDRVSDSLASMLNAQGAQLRYSLYKDDSYRKLYEQRLENSIHSARQAKDFMSDQTRMAATDAYIAQLEQYRVLFNQLVSHTEQATRQRADTRERMNDMGMALEKIVAALAELTETQIDSHLFAMEAQVLTLLNHFSLSRMNIASFELNPTSDTAEAARQGLRIIRDQLEQVRAGMQLENSRILGEKADAALDAAEKSQEEFFNRELQRMATLSSIRALSASMVTKATDLAQLSMNSVREANASADTQVMTVLVVAMLLGLLAALYISTNVQGQLGKDPAELRNIAQRVTNGDYAIDDGSPKKGVYGYLVEMVNTLEQHINNAREASELAAKESHNAQKAMREAEAAEAEARAKTEAMLLAADKLEEVANVVSSASTELSAQIEQSERGSADQAARVTETATAMEEMNSTVVEVAQNAGIAAEVSAQTRGKADAGAGIVRNAVDSIQQVQRESLALKKDMAALSEHAQAISQIMSVISDIADQTNLLALNAAIEAARAGDAGRGFAVVADEVRNLAEKTMTSTTDVGNAIKAIQDSAAKSMEQVDKAVKSIEEATDFASQSGDALQEIVNMADHTADQVRAIATAAEQQSASSEEISQSIHQVNTIAGETARAMEEAARAVVDLARQAQVLTGLIEDMKRG